MTTDSSFEAPREVPRTALLLSLLCLAIPLASSLYFPEWTAEDVGMLAWLLALVPGFLLSYYRGWKGASVALAAGMAAFSVAQAVVVATDASLPPAELLLGIVLVLTVVSLGSGLLSTLFHRSLNRAERLALTDTGTGIPNRRHAMLELEKAFAAAQRGARLSVVIFDLDHFKRVNDEHGHTEGDRVLARFAGILVGKCRAMNLVARFGGEEFIAVVRDAPADGARIFADRVREALRAAEFKCGTMTVSAGVAEYEEGMASPEVLVAAADQALYRAKRDGRDRVVVLSNQGRRGSASETPAEPDPDEVPRGAGELVLVVDDDPDALRSVAQALRRFGYTVLEAPAPGRAVEIARGLEEPLDLVVTDIVMPEMGGFRLVEMLEEVQESVRAVYMSGYSQEEVDWGGVPGDAYGYLSKPISIYTLARRIRGLLDQPVQTENQALPMLAVPEPDEDPTVPPLLSRQHPIDATDPARTTKPMDGPAPLDPDARIFIVHPDSERGRFVAGLLHQEGWSAVETSDRMDTVLDRLPHLRHGLLVVDLGLPEAAVRDLVDALRLRTSSAPAVLFLMDPGNRRLRAEALSLPRSDFVAKPFAGVELRARARNLVRAGSYERLLSQAEDRVRNRVAARTAELEEAREEVLLRLARAAEFRDDLTGRHAQRVGVLAGLLARELGWPASRREILEKAAPLHDLGKIAIPDAILRKPGQLTAAERQVMERHTTVGAELLSGSRNPILREAERIARTHHERWDGSGYPAGLPAEDIPESGRIVAVVDTYDSLTSQRPYREAIARHEATRMIREDSGAAFEPRLVNAFERVLARGGLERALDLEVVARPG